MLSMPQIEAADFPQARPADLRPGDKVRVHVRIVEVIAGGKAGRTAGKLADRTKVRTQVFEGTVIALRRAGHRSTFTVRKISYGVGVERVFPIESPNVEQIEIVARHRVRRAKLYYMRGLRGRSARLKTVR
ncbi:MAG: 50S ribosomal protein L19 [Deltaproteobacteria bacterium]|nr:50S ribosomal protein L19 [Deltaproteobacteria bacterium]